jgi:hypothetical protein
VGDGNLDADIARSGIRRQDQRGAVVLLAAGVLAALLVAIAARCSIITFQLPQYHLAPRLSL